MLFGNLFVIYLRSIRKKLFGLQRFLVQNLVKFLRTFTILVGPPFCTHLIVDEADAAASREMITKTVRETAFGNCRNDDGYDYQENASILAASPFQPNIH